MHSLSHTLGKIPGYATGFDYINIYIYVVSVDLGGNPSTIFLLVYALIAGVIGECSVILGFAYLRVWNNASLAGAATSAIISWAVTALAFGYFIWFS